MVTVTKTDDDNTAQTFVMPSGTSGMVYVRVIDTDRTPGRRVLDTLYVDKMDFLSTDGPILAMVPEVTGLAQATATSDLAAVNLVAGTITNQASSTVPAGNVISQNPPVGTTLAVGSGVDLVVSLGTATVTVPAVTGLAQTTAQSSIVAANLVVGTITNENSSTVPSGNVISQSPSGGTDSAVGSSVNLLISIGPASDYAVWQANYPGTNLGSPDADYDGDGMSNNAERLFGLDPTSGGSSNPITVPLDPTNGTFTYTRRNRSLTNASFTYEWISNFSEGAWTTFTAASEEANAGSPVETVTVTIPAALLSNQRLFIRVRATAP
jgi:hypothetical protein